MTHMTKKEIKQYTEKMNQVVGAIDDNGFFTLKDKLTVVGSHGDWYVYNATRRMGVSSSYDTRKEAEIALRQIRNSEEETGLA